MGKDVLTSLAIPPAPPHVIFPSTLLGMPLTKFGKELFEDAHKVAQGEVIVSYDTLNLVELSQVGGIQCLITENSVNGEVLGWGEGLLLGKAIECPGTGSCSVCP